MRWFLKWLKFFFLLILLLPLMPFVMFAAAFDPSLCMNISRLRVVNRTIRPIWVTPVGTFDSGSREVLDQFLFALPAIPAVRATNHRIKPGGEKWICFHPKGLVTYEIVVRNADGEYRQVVIDPPIPLPPAPYWARFGRTHVVEEGSLPPVSDELLASAMGGGFNGKLWVAYLIGAGMLGFYSGILGFYCWLLIAGR